MLAMYITLTHMHEIVVIQVLPNFFFTSVPMGEVICGMLESVNTSRPVFETNPRNVGTVILSTNDDRVKIGNNQTELLLIDVDSESPFPYI